jgi:hypothetical protein
MDYIIHIDLESMTYGGLEPCAPSEEHKTGFQGVTLQAEDTHRFSVASSKAGS